MSDELDKLKAALDGVAADGPPVRGRRAFATPAEGVHLILDAIDRAVLPRRLTLSFDEGTEVTTSS